MDYIWVFKQFLLREQRFEKDKRNKDTFKLTPAISFITMWSNITVLHNNSMMVLHIIRTYFYVVMCICINVVFLFISSFSATFICFVQVY